MIRIMYSSAAHWMKLKGRINRSIRRYVVAAGCVAVNRDGDERFEIRNATSVVEKYARNGMKKQAVFRWFCRMSSNRGI
jgi:hypothetical protein